MPSLRPYRTYTSYGDALVAVSALEAGGFHPVQANEVHTRSNHFHALALGGYWLFLPENEHEAAADWQAWLKTQAIDADDPTPHPYLKRRGTGLLHLFVIGVLGIMLAA